MGLIHDIFGSWRGAFRLPYERDCQQKNKKPDRIFLPGEHNLKSRENWLEKGKPIDPRSAYEVASDAWDLIHTPEYEMLQEPLYKAITDRFPTAPVEEWKINRSAFGEFFRELAERERNFTFKVEVLIGPVENDDLTSFTSITSDGATPSRAGQGIRIKISASHPASFYAFWLTPGSVAQPLFPWEPTLNPKTAEVEYPLRIARNILQKELVLPADRGCWDLPAERGLETLIAFATFEPLTTQALRSLERKLVNELDMPVFESGPGPFVHDLRNECNAEHSISFARLNLKDVRSLRDPVIDRHRLIADLIPEVAGGSCISFRNDGGNP